MARTKTEIEDSSVDPLEFKDLPALTDTVNSVATGDMMVMQSFETIKAIGRIETAQFYATVAEKLIAETAKIWQYQPYNLV